MALDLFSRNHYELRLKLKFLDATEKEFQTFFSNVMVRRYPDDFVRVAPWGSAGDLKNDGYLASARQLFGVYAPYGMKFSKAKAKITTDFVGAIKHWNHHYDEWVLVHNSRPNEGLGAPYLQLLADLSTKHKKKAVQWGYDSIRPRVFDLSAVDIQEILGAIPTPQDYLNVGFDDVRDVLNNIAEHEPDPLAPVRPVPPGKAAAAGLSAEATGLLAVGMRKADYIGRYFAKAFDPTKGERIAEAFKSQYAGLAASGLQPDDVLLRLFTFAAGDKTHGAKHEAATWTVLAYLFERCDIFTVEATAS